MAAGPDAREAPANSTVIDRSRRQEAFVTASAPTLATAARPFGRPLSATSVATSAALVAATDPTVRSLALLSASTDYRGLRIEAALRKADCPVLLVAGSNDPYALRSAVVLAATGSRRETMTLPDAGHGTTMLVRQPELTDRLVDWFRRTLL